MRYFILYFSANIQSVVITLKLYKYSYKTEIFNKNIVFDLGEHEKMDEDLILTAYLQHFICEMLGCEINTLALSNKKRRKL